MLLVVTGPILVGGMVGIRRVEEDGWRYLGLFEYMNLFVTISRIFFFFFEVKNHHQRKLVIYLT